MERWQNSGRGFSEAIGYVHAAQASIYTSVHVIIYICLILILKCYGVNKHNLLTTSFLLTNQVVNIAGSTDYQRKSTIVVL